MQKRCLAAVCALTVLAGTTISAYAAEPVSAKPTRDSGQKVYVDMVRVYPTGYQIGGNNFFKLRDIGTLVGFGVEWDQSTQTVEISTARTTPSTAGISDSSVAGATAKLSHQKITVDGKPVSMTAYSIGGNNYVKLRDVGTQVGFDVDFDTATSSVLIDTGTALTPGTASNGMEYLKNVAYIGDKENCRMPRETAESFAKVLQDIPASESYYAGTLYPYATLFDLGEDSLPLLMVSYRNDTASQYGNDFYTGTRPRFWYSTPQGSREMALSTDNDKFMNYAWYAASIEGKPCVIGYYISGQNVGTPIRYEIYTAHEGKMEKTHQVTLYEAVHIDGQPSNLVFSTDFANVDNYRIYQGQYPQYGADIDTLLAAGWFANDTSYGSTKETAYFYAEIDGMPWKPTDSISAGYVGVSDTVLQDLQISGYTAGAGSRENSVLYTDDLCIGREFGGTSAKIMAQYLTMYAAAHANG